MNASGGTIQPRPTSDGAPVIVSEGEVFFPGPPPPHPICRVYWGSHGCDRPRGHEGPCVCLSCLYDNGRPDWDGYVGMPPYYGAGTTFYGEDAEARGLPAHTEEGSS